MLTSREYLALRAEWMRARGIAPPMTAQERDNLEAGRRHIREAQVRAHNLMVEKRRASGLYPAEIPIRQEAVN